MINNYIPNSDLAFIVGDGGLSRASPAPTTVAGQKVNACLETQSTTRADFFIKPKTDAQINAIQNPTEGMVAFSSDSSAIVVRDNTGWTTLTPSQASPILHASIDLDSATMLLALERVVGAAPVILPAPGPGLRYVIHDMNLNYYENATTYSPSSANGVRAVYDFFFSELQGYTAFASGLIPYSFFVNEENDGDRSYYVTGDSTGVNELALTTNVNILLTAVGNTGFTVHGFPTGKVDIWYSIISY